MAAFSFQPNEELSDSFSDTYTSEDETDVDIGELCMCLEAVIPYQFEPFASDILYRRAG